MAPPHRTDRATTRNGYAISNFALRINARFCEPLVGNQKFLSAPRRRRSGLVQTGRGGRSMGSVTSGDLRKANTAQKTKDVQCTWDLLTGKTSEKLRINPRKAWYRNLEEVTTNGD